MGKYNGLRIVGAQMSIIEALVDLTLANQESGPRHELAAKQVLNVVSEFAQALSNDGTIAMFDKIARDVEYARSNYNRNTPTTADTMPPPD